MLRQSQSTCWPSSILRELLRWILICCLVLVWFNYWSWRNIPTNVKPPDNLILFLEQGLFIQLPKCWLQGNCSLRIQAARMLRFPIWLVFVRIVGWLTSWNQIWLLAMDNGGIIWSKMVWLLRITWLPPVLVYRNPFILLDLCLNFLNPVVQIFPQLLFQLILNLLIIMSILLMNLVWKTLYLLFNSVTFAKETHPSFQLL